MKRNAELQFGTAFCVRRAAIKPNSSIPSVHAASAFEKSKAGFLRT